MDLPVSCDLDSILRANVDAMSKVVVFTCAIWIVCSGLAWSGGTSGAQCNVVVAPGAVCPAIVAPQPLHSTIVAPRRTCGRIIAPAPLCARLAVPPSLCPVPVVPACVPGAIVAPAPLCTTLAVPPSVCTRYTTEAGCAAPRFPQAPPVNLCR